MPVVVTAPSPTPRAYCWCFNICDGWGALQQQRNSTTHICVVELRGCRGTPDHSSGPSDGCQAWWVDDEVHSVGDIGGNGAMGVGALCSISLSDMWCPSTTHTAHQAMIGMYVCCVTAVADTTVGNTSRACGVCCSIHHGAHAMCITIACTMRMGCVWCVAFTREWCDAR